MRPGQGASVLTWPLGPTDLRAGRWRGCQRGGGGLRVCSDGRWTGDCPSGDAELDQKYTVLVFEYVVYWLPG